MRLHILARIEDILPKIAFQTSLKKPATAFMMPVIVPYTPSIPSDAVDLMFSQTPEKNDTMPSHTDSKRVFAPFQTVSHRLWMRPRPAVSRSCMAVQLPSKTACMASHTATAISWMAFHAPCQSPVKTDLMKLATPVTMSRKSSRTLPMLSHRTLKYERI